MLKSHTEEIDCEREIETRELSIILDRVTFREQSRFVGRSNFQYPGFRVWAVPHTVATNVPI